jgi:hypothetical protein
MKKVDEARQKLFRDAAEQRERRDRIRDRIRQHAAGNANAHLADSTQEPCRKLRQAGMAPRVLCDLVEVAEPEWTAAAEGLLGRDREAVFVDRAQIVQATALFKEGRREFRGATLVSLNKLDGNRTLPQPGTFPTLFRSQDHDAMGFIMRRYGSVRLAQNLNEFNAPGRAIMKDGLYDDGLVRTHRASDPSGYKIGKTAQTKALRDLEDQAWQLDDAAEETGKLARATDGALGALKALSEDTGAALSALAATYAAATKECAEAIARIGALDGTGDGGLRDKRRAQTEHKVARVSARARAAACSQQARGRSAGLRPQAHGRRARPARTRTSRQPGRSSQDAAALRPRRGRAAHRERLAAVGPKKSELERHRAVAAKANSGEGAADAERGRIERRVREALGAYFDAFGVSSEIGVERAVARDQALDGAADRRDRDQRAAPL